MNNSLDFATDDFRERAVSPQRELGAYEALWVEKGASFKTIADKFRENLNGVPSDFVPESTSQKFFRNVMASIKDAGIRHFGIRVNGAGEYPSQLRDADHPIELLYFQGWWDLVNTRCVAIVGSRKPSEEGRSRANKLAQLLVDDDYTIVSGLASGIDTIVHNAAISAGGRTIAVLGTPVTSNYPRENAQLQQRIADEFLLISQVPIVRYGNGNPRSNRFFFPERNKTMSALTEATIIVEAGNTSGTLVQARAALAQRRKLFILNSCFENPEIDWPQRFEAKGAIRIREFDELRSHLGSS